MGPIDGPVAPLWMPFALTVALAAWIFVWYFVLRYLWTLDDPARARNGQIADAPPWKTALVLAVGMPAALIAAGGALVMVLLAIEAVISIATH